MPCPMHPALCPLSYAPPIHRPCALYAPALRQWGANRGAIIASKPPQHPRNSRYGIAIIGQNNARAHNPQPASMPCPEQSLPRPATTSFLPRANRFIGRPSPPPIALIKYRLDKISP